MPAMLCRFRLAALAVALGPCLGPAAAIAGPVEIVSATARADGDGFWTFTVTLRHDDTGWSHYADGWAVIAPDGRVLGVRELLHPHVREQPFTRSLSRVEIPPTIDEVFIRARTNKEGWSETTYRLGLRPPSRRPSISQPER